MMDSQGYKKTKTQDLRIAPQLARFVSIKPLKYEHISVNRVSPK
jgi:hypothetical protein